ncbi:pre-tRNA nuclear export protein, partial [Coemansia guatemalensis]
DKLQYSEDYTWPSPTDAAFGDNDGSLDEDDDEAMFNELRHNLRVFIDAIGQIAPDLYNSVILTTAQGIFEQCNQHGVSFDRAFDEGDKGRGQLGWIRAELGIYLTQAYGELLSSSKGLRFGAPRHGQSGAGNQGNNATPAGPSAESLKNLLTMMIQSNVVSSSHPSIAPMYFENVVRFGGYFEVQREAVTPVLTAFLGNTGVRHPYNTVRPRIWYFLHRFVKQLPGSVLAPFSSDFISAVTSMLKINADPAVLGGASGVASSYGLFDSQLFLFESCGMMLAPVDLDDSTRMTLLQHLLGPLFSGAQRLMNSKSAEQILQDTQGLLQIHHYLTAIGSVVKGFPDVRVDSKTTSASTPQQLSPNTVQVFLKAADMCVTILGALRANQLIRESARFTLSRMLGVLGAEALPYLSQLANSLVSSCAVEELVDLLGLLGQVVFKFKPHVAPTASELLLPVISKVYGFLDQVAQNGAAGTDEAVLLQELQKAYLSWIVAIFNSDLDCIFLAPQNVHHLITIFRPIAAQLATDSSNPQCQRLAFSALSKAIQAWLVDPQGWHTLATLSSATVAAINNKGIPIASVAVPQRGAAAYGRSTGQGAHQDNGQAGQAESLSNASGYMPPPPSMVSDSHSVLEQHPFGPRVTRPRFDNPNDVTLPNSQAGKSPLGTGFMQFSPRATFSGASKTSSGFNAPPNSYSTQEPVSAYGKPPSGLDISQRLADISEKGWEDSDTAKSNTALQKKDNRPSDDPSDGVFEMYD